MNKLSMLCYGEILWDCLPDGRVPGGAPLNLAYHAHQLHQDVAVISKVGSDDNGEELLQWMREKGLETNCMQTDATIPSGIVEVELHGEGVPVFDIKKPSAWDFIDFDVNVQTLIAACDVFIFGSLPCRMEVSRNTLLQYLAVAPRVVMDMNLRPPHYERDIIESMIRRADIVKMNEDEKDMLCQWNQITGDEVSQLKSIEEKFGISMIILTKGPHGAACYAADKYYQYPGFRVKVVDTVGSGDAFLAAFLSSHLNGEDIPTALMKGCRYGAYVASKAGGTPILNVEELNTIAV